MELNDSIHTAYIHVKQCLQYIEHNKSLNAFVNIYTEEALHKARELDAITQHTTTDQLTGVVIGIKDLFCYKDHPVQACSNILSKFIAQFSATAVQRIIDAKGIIIGHQNCDEFGMGASNEYSTFGPVVHPLDPTRVPGGSSGGSAVAVKKDMCHISLGSDTGGSIRQPAAFCGVVGLKPTYGRISRHGLIAYASSLDTIGLLAKNIDIIAKTLEVIAGPDNFDHTVWKEPMLDSFMDFPFDKKMNIAFIKETLEGDFLQKEVKEQTLKALDTLKKLGHTLTPISFPLLPYTLPTYFILSNAEASTNLARYDGIRFGNRYSDCQDIEQMYVQTRTKGFGKEVQRRILAGSFVLSAQYYDKYYKKAQKIKNAVQKKFIKIFSEYDFIISPTTPTTAFHFGEYTKNPQKMYNTDLYTVPASLAGIPAISIPNGLDQNGLPIGLQIMANAFQEPALLAFSNQIINML